MFRLLAAIAMMAPVGQAAGYRVMAVTPHVSVVQGPINGVLVRQHGKVLAVYGDPRPDATPRAEKVLFTHHRRDVAWAGRALVRQGAEAVVPAGESQFFTGAAQFWEKFRTARFHDYAQQTTKILTEPLAKVAAVRGGETIEWEGISIRVLDTPGYTRGAVSYLFEADGKRIACTGDLLYGDGRILDLYSLQDAIPETKEDGYHGYGARAADLIRSLRKIQEWKPDVVVPARGPIITPGSAAVSAIGRLIARLQAVFASHFAIDALRWYRGDERLRAQAGRILGLQPVQWMAMGETVGLPGWIVPIANSRLIVSRTGAGFLVDCGSRGIIEELKKLQQAGRFSRLDGIYVTHYHNDHTDSVQAAAEEFHCPVIACAEMRDILERPGAYRMPALTPNPTREVRAMAEGEKQRWNEFEFTYSYFPGQTLYHGGLLAARTGPEAAGPVFFIGDSFTPSGIDDYCLLNRNFMPPEKGLADCLRVVKSLPAETLLINQHVAPAFRFSAGQLDAMPANLERRRQLFAELFPWDDPNFGLDEQWARFYPYALDAQPGKAVELQVAILNHSGRRREFRVTPHAPAGWKTPAAPLRITIEPHRERLLRFSLTPPAGASGLAVITADVAFAEWELHEWVEALVTVADRR